MAKSEPRESPEERPVPSGAAPTDAGETAYEADVRRAKRRLVSACAVIACGIAVAGSFAPTAGGVILLGGWAAGIAALHRFGRLGADSGARPR